MRMNRPVLLSLPLLGLALAGCQTDGPKLSTSLRLALPLEAAELEFFKLVVSVDGEVLDTYEASEGPTVDDLEYTFEVPVGAEVEVEALFFDLRVADGLYAVSGAGSEIVTTDTEVIDLTVEEQPVVATTVSTVFDNGKDLTIPALLNLEDTTTGFGVGGAFETGTSFNLPFGREVRLAGTNPKTGAEFSITVTIDGTGSINVDIPIGQAPDAPTGVLPANDGGISMQDLAADNQYDILCAVGTDCAEVTEWLSCEDLSFTPSIPNLEGDDGLAIRLLVQYVGVEDSCVGLAIDYDLTPPRLTVRLDPNVLMPGVDTTDLGIDADEVLSAGTIAVRRAGETTNLCTTVLEEGQPDCFHQFCCPGIDLAAAPEGAVTLEITAGDVAGNTATVQATVDKVAATSITEGAAEIVVRSYDPFLPDAPSPQNPQIPILVVLENIDSTADACDITLSTGAFDRITATGSEPAAWTVVRTQPASTLPAGSTTEVWIQLGPTVFNDPLLPGDYEIELIINWMGCQDEAADSIQPRIRVTIARPARWLTNDRVHLSLLHGRYPVDSNRYDFRRFDLPYGGGAGSVDSNHFSFTTVPAGALSVTANLQQEEPLLVEVTTDVAGEYILNMTNDLIAPGAVADAVPLTLHPATSLLALQSEAAGGTYQVTRVNPLDESSEALVFDPTNVGAPFQVLWDGARDQITVVADQADAPGTNGLLIGIGSGSPLREVRGPCDADHVLRAVMTATLPGHSGDQPDIALLVERAGAFFHCEIDPDTGSVVQVGSTAVNFPHDPTCQPSTLVSDVITGEFAVFGSDPDFFNSCARVYHTRTGSLVEIGATIADSWDEHPIYAAHDPFGNFTVTFGDATDAQLTAAGWSLGAYPARSYVDFYTGSVGYGPTAAAIDPMYGDVFVARDDDSTYTQKILQFDDRFMAEVPASEGTRDNFVTPSGPAHALAIDSSNRRIYAGYSAREGEPPQKPSFTVSHTGEIGNTYWSSTPFYELDPNLGAGAVIDMTVAGPQALLLSVDRAMAGDAITVNGLGFSGCDIGDGAYSATDQGCGFSDRPGIWIPPDRVFVQGIEAPVVRATTTSITFEVPKAFRGVDRDFVYVWVTVLAHGVMSGPAGTPLGIARHAAAYTWQGGGPRNYPVFEQCLPPVCRADLLPGPTEAPILSAQYSISRIDSWDWSPQPITLAWDGGDYFTTTRGGHRVIGTSPDQVRMMEPPRWLDLRLRRIDWGLDEAPRISPNEPELTDAGPIAVRSNDTLLALAKLGRVQFFWATALTPYPFETLTGPFEVFTDDIIEHLAFSRDGAFLFATSSAGELAVVKIAADPILEPAVQVVDDSGACPSGTASVLALSPLGTTNAMALLEWYPDDLEVASWFVAPGGAGGWEKVCNNAVAPLTDLLPTELLRDPLLDSFVGVSLAVATSPTADIVAVAGVASAQPEDPPVPYDVPFFVLVDRFSLEPVSPLESVSISAARAVDFTRSAATVHAVGESGGFAFQLYPYPVLPDPGPM